jgi:hypothetical protein
MSTQSLTVLNGFENYKRREWLSVNDLVNFKRCPRRFFYRTGCLMGVAAGEPALAFGEAVHAAFAATYLNGPAAGYEEFVKLWGNQEVDDKRNNFTAMRLLQDFHATHCCEPRLYDLVPPPSTTVRLSERVSDYELPFCLDIGLHVPFVGRVDGLCKLRSDNTIWGLEYKTTSELTSRFFQAFELSPQIIAYTMALRTLGLPNLPGFVVTAVRVSKTNSLSMSNHIYVKDHHIDWFIRWAQKTAAEIHWCEENKCFPPDYSGCHPYAGFGSHGYLCDYYQMCQVDDWTTLKDLYPKVNDRPYSLIFPSDGNKPQCSPLSTQMSPSMSSTDTPTSTTEDSKGQKPEIELSTAGHPVAINWS